MAERGRAATTEEIAVRAGVAVGTVFRHFPTKQDLLAALMKDLSAQMVAQARALADGPDGLFTFFVALAVLVARGQQAKLVRTDVGVDEVLALLTLATQSVLQQRWDAELRRRTLALILDGLRPR